MEPPSDFSTFVIQDKSCSCSFFFFQIRFSSFPLGYISAGVKNCHVLQSKSCRSIRNLGWAPAVGKSILFMKHEVQYTNTLIKSYL